MMSTMVALSLSLLLHLPQQQPPPLRDAGEHASRPVEMDYAAREQNSPPLEDFRGGGGEALLYAPMLAVGVVYLIGYGFVELAKVLF
jgi:hypothetical protein